MTLITLPQSGSIIDLDSVSFVIKIQNKTGVRGVRIGLDDSELQIITPADALRFLEELSESKQVNVENLLKWIRLTPTNILPAAEPQRPAPSQQPEPVGAGRPKPKIGGASRRTTLMFRKRKDETKKAETSNVEAAATSPVTREEIALCAYYIWAKGGRPEGCALEHWLQAELQLRAARSLDAYRPR